MLPFIAALEMHVHDMFFPLPSSNSCPLASELEPLERKFSEFNTVSQIWKKTSGLWIHGSPSPAKAEVLFADKV